MNTGTNKYKTLPGAIAGLLIAIYSVGAHANQNDTRYLLEQTGITTQIHALSSMVEESSRTHAARCKTSPADKLIIGFSADSVIYDLVSGFDSTHPQSLKPVEHWYQSALAKKIQSEEKQTIDPSSFAAFLQSEKFTDLSRKEVIERLIDNLQTPRFVAIVGTEVEYAGMVHSGCTNKKDVDSATNSEQLMADITRNDKDLITALVRGEIVAETAYLYRNLSNEELNKYEAFTASKNGQRFYSHLIDAMQNSLRIAGDRLTISVNSDIHGSIDF